MPFISYAQNFEDVILWRALNKIEKGFYVDVGAYDPVEVSVTKAFYDRGWRGINIEPVRHWYDKLVLARPEDINLNIAISEETGNLRLYNIPGTGLSTFDRQIADKYKEESGFETQEIIVPVFPLENILAQYPVEDIHFLKVDVEGAERQVFKSIDLTRTRPWIILTEITYLPTWQPLLIDRGYDFVYFDGLNNFYLAQERSELKSAFGTPPNVFDDFIRSRELENSMHVQKLEAELQALYNSNSWKISAPFRKLSDLLKRFF